VNIIAGSTKRRRRSPSTAATSKLTRTVAQREKAAPFPGTAGGRRSRGREPLPRARGRHAAAWSTGGVHRRARETLDRVGLSWTHTISLRPERERAATVLVVKACYVDAAEIIIFDEASASLTMPTRSCSPDRRRARAAGARSSTSHTGSTNAQGVRSRDRPARRRVPETVPCTELDEVALATLIVGKRSPPRVRGQETASDGSCSMSPG
jgi:hypothetical protein